MHVPVLYLRIFIAGRTYRWPGDGFVTQCTRYWREIPNSLHFFLTNKLGEEISVGLG